MKSTPANNDVPHSWDVANWPPGIWPNDPKKAMWVIRANKGELVAAGAVSRVGRTKVIIGQAYARWLARRVTRVTDFVPNNPSIGRPRP